MRKVLFWSDSLPPQVGGVEVLAAKFLAAMSARGWQFSAITRGENSQIEHDFLGETPVLRVPLRHALETRSPLLLLQIKRAIHELRAQFAPDVLHVYHLGLGAVLLDSLRDLPRLLTLHEHVAPEILHPNGALSALLRNTDFVSACSQSVLDDFQAQCPQWAGDSRSRAILNALDWPTISPAPLPFSPPHIVCLGRIVREKGFDCALEAFAQLQKQWPDARFSLAGDGPELPALKRLAQNLQIAEKTQFCGWIAPENVPQFLNRTVLVVPSRWREPFGLVALQGAQMARPVVATNVGGLPEIVQNGITGTLISPENPAELARALLELLQNPARAQQMGEAARREAQTRFRWEVHLDDYEQLLAALAARR